MHAVELPALDGRDPLGFLAALGLLAVLDRHDQPRDPVALSFSTENACAILHSRHPTVEAIAAALTGIVTRMPEGQVIPGVIGFPLPPASTGGDPLRMTPDRYRFLVREMRKIRRRHRRSGRDLPAGQWLARIINPHVPDARGNATLTPYMAPRGRQSVYTFFASPLALVKDQPDYLLQALTRWRRVAGCTGENLDWRALITAADAPDGRPASYGVPGATWLATQALALTHLSAQQRIAVHTSKTGQQWRIRSSIARATLWHPWRPASVMVWPLWERPLPARQVHTLLHHRDLAPYRDGVELDSAPAVHRYAWRQQPDERWTLVDLREELGVFAVAGASRIPGQHCSGLLAPLRAVYSDDRQQPYQQQLEQHARRSRLASFGLAHAGK